MEPAKAKISRKDMVKARKKAMPMAMGTANPRDRPTVMAAAWAKAQDMTEVIVVVVAVEVVVAEATNYCCLYKNLSQEAKSSQSFFSCLGVSVRVVFIHRFTSYSPISSRQGTHMVVSGINKILPRGMGSPHSRHMPNSGSSIWESAHFSLVNFTLAADKAA